MKATMKHYTIRNASNEQIITPGIATESQPFLIHLHINPNEFVSIDQLPEFEMEEFIDSSYTEYVDCEDQGDRDVLNYLLDEAVEKINTETDLWLEEERDEFAARIQQQLRTENAIEDWTRINIVWTEKASHYDRSDFYFLL